MLGDVGCWLLVGKEGNAGMLAYSASKAGVIGLTKVEPAKQTSVAHACGLLLVGAGCWLLATAGDRQGVCRDGHNVQRSGASGDSHGHGRRPARRSGAPALPWWLAWQVYCARVFAWQVKYMTDKIPMKRCGTIEEISDLVAYIASKQVSRCFAEFDLGKFHDRFYMGCHRWPGHVLTLSNKIPSN